MKLRPTLTAAAAERRNNLAMEQRAFERREREMLQAGLAQAAAVARRQGVAVDPPVTDGRAGPLVTARDGSTGTFDPEGRYLHGEVRSVDPELARWVGLGPRERGDVSLNRRFLGASDVMRKNAAALAAASTKGATA